MLPDFRGVIMQTEEELLTEVFDIIPSAVIILDRHGVVIRANEAAFTLLSSDVLIGRRWVELVSEVFSPR